jgi:prevent-host-death family protein
MQISTGDARNRLSDLLRQVEENGETIVITRHGKAVAQIGPVRARRRAPRLGLMKDRIRLLPGWDAPVDPDDFLNGKL